jgi:hypothetical protein
VVPDLRRISFAHSRVRLCRDCAAALASQIQRNRPKRATLRAVRALLEELLGADWSAGKLEVGIDLREALDAAVDARHLVELDEVLRDG